MNLYPVAIIENFYENPDAIRQFALKQEYSFCHERKNIKYDKRRNKKIRDGIVGSS
jgi:hypothetical protein